MSSKKTYTKEEYELIYKSKDQEENDLELIDRRLFKTNNSTIKSYIHINNVDNKIVGAIHNNGTVSVYHDVNEMVDYLSQYIKDGVNSRLKKLPLIAGNINKTIDFLYFLIYNTVYYIGGLFVLPIIRRKIVQIEKWQYFKYDYRKSWIKFIDEIIGF